MIPLESLTTTSPEPVPAAASSLPSGRAVPVDAVAIQPGDIGQLFYRAEGGEILRGLTVSPGAQVVKVLVGREQYPAPGQTDWKACLGKEAPAGSYVIALVQNTTAQVIHAAGCWYVEGGAPSAPAPSNPAVQVQGIIAPSAVATTQYVDSSVAAAPVPGSVIPGPNEVAVLLVRSEALALLERIRTNMPLAYHEAPSIVRRLNAALGIR